MNLALVEKINILFLSQTFNSKKKIVVYKFPDLEYFFFLEEIYCKNLMFFFSSKNKRGMMNMQRGGDY
jgi:hypothetical protein